MKRILFTAVIALIGTQAIAQKGNTASANLSFRNYMQERASDMEAAVKELKDAKEFIDLSMAHEEWKNDAKTLMVFGKIYFEIPQAAVATNDADLLKVDAEKAWEDAFDAFKAVKEQAKTNSKAQRWADEVDEHCGLYYAQLQRFGINAYSKEEWATAAGMLIGAGMFSEIITPVDSASFYYAGNAAYAIDSFSIAEEGFKKSVELGFQYGSSVYFLSQTYQKQGKVKEAEDMLVAESKSHPGDKDVLIELINLYIGQDKKEEAVTALEAAIALDPENPKLLYTSGTIYENLDNFEEAEKAYKKVIEKEPKNVDASFAIGGLYFNKGADLNNAANKLEFGDPKYDTMTAEAKEYFNKAIPFLEVAAENAPEDKVILTSLKDAYGKAGNTEKFLEIKKKLEGM